MRTIPCITVIQVGNRHGVIIDFRYCKIYPSPCQYSRRPDAIRGAVRALRRIGYRGEYQVSLI